MTEIYWLDKSMSPCITSSELSLLNSDADNRTVPVSTVLIPLLATAKTSFDGRKYF
jgi:thiamine biosynthesis lipoprotein ApbE